MARHLGIVNLTLILMLQIYFASLIEAQWSSLSPLSTRTPDCGENGTWSACHPCTDNCSNYQDERICLGNCNIGCYPNLGFVFLNGESGKIIRPVDCPPVIRKCAPNLVWKEPCSDSGRRCAPNCHNLQNPPDCTTTTMYYYCAPGCDPAEGFVFVEGQSGDVIRIERCST